MREATFLVAAVAACHSSAQQRGDAGDDASPDSAGSDSSGEPSCDAPAPFGSTLVPTRIVYVEPGATGGDGTLADPFGTIEAAASSATPGTAIRLLPGTHATSQYVEALRGTEAAPIWIGGEPGQSPPVIVAGGEGLHLTKPAYVIVHDLELHDQITNGINVDDGADYANPTAAHHISIERLYVHDAGSDGGDCIKVSGINDLWIYDSRIERCGGGAEGSAIDHVGCHRVVVARDAIDSVVATAIQIKGGSTDVDVRQNRIRDPGDRGVNLGGWTDSDKFRPPLSATVPNAEARRVHVYDNAITGAMSTPFAFTGCVDCLVANNFVRGPASYLLRILQEKTTEGSYVLEPTQDGRVIANSFAFSAASLTSTVNIGPGTLAMTFSFSHNAWLATDDPAMSSPSLPVAEIGSVIGVPTGYAHVPDDPRAPLPPLCTGAEVGVGTTVPEVTGTIEGECRTGAPTIGPQQKAPSCP